MKIDSIATILNLSQPSATRADSAGLAVLFPELFGPDSAGGTPGSGATSLFAQLLGALSEKGNTNLAQAAEKLTGELRDALQEQGELAGDPGSALDGVYALIGGLFPAQPVPTTQPVPAAEAPEPISEWSAKAAEPVEPTGGLALEPLEIKAAAAAGQPTSSQLPVGSQAAFAPDPQADCSLPIPSAEQPALVSEPAGDVAAKGVKTAPQPAPVIESQAATPATIEASSNGTATATTATATQTETPAIAAESTLTPAAHQKSGTSGSKERTSRDNIDLVAGIGVATTPMIAAPANAGSDLSDQKEGSANDPSESMHEMKLNKVSSRGHQVTHEPHPPTGFSINDAPVPLDDVALHVEQLALDFLQHPQQAEPTTVVLKLEPPELGRVEVHLSLSHDDSLSIRMIAPDDAARQVIERQMNQLQQSLSDQGVSWNQCSVECGVSGQSQQQQQLPQFHNFEWDAIPISKARPSASFSTGAAPVSRTRVDYVA